MPVINKKPKILLLGTIHMRPTTDLFTTELDDLLSAKRQQEILDVVERVKKFRPTKVALEVEHKKNDSINEQYLQYRNGNFELPVSEVYQVGFRIASDLIHEQVHCIDWMEKGAGTKGVGEVYEWAKEHQPELFEEIFGWLHRSGNDNTSVSCKSILDMYRDCNEPSGVKQHHTMNINIARIGDRNNYVGMEWLTWWYQRNLILFSNLARLADSSDDRIMLIIGSAHTQILTRFIEESGLFELVNPLDYLE